MITFILIRVLIVLTNVVSAIVEAYFDVRRVKNKRVILHWWSDILRACSWIIVSSIFNWWDPWLVFWFSLSLGSSYWLTFDYAYNWFFGHPSGYLSESSNFQDKILIKLSGGDSKKAFLIKLASFIFSIAGYIITKIL